MHRSLRTIMYRARSQGTIFSYKLHQSIHITLPVIDFFFIELGKHISIICVFNLYYVQWNKTYLYNYYVSKSKTDRMKKKVLLDNHVSGNRRNTEITKILNSMELEMFMTCSCLQAQDEAYL